MSPRWILYSILSGRGVVLYGEDPDLVKGACDIARAYKTSHGPADGDRFRLQRIPDHQDIEETRDFRFRAARPDTMEIDG